MTQREFQTIRRTPADRTCAAFSDTGDARTSLLWEDARSEIQGLPGGGLNIAHGAVGRHLDIHGPRIAMRWPGRDGTRSEITHAERGARAVRFANVLVAAPTLFRRKGAAWHDDLLSQKLVLIVEDDGDAPDGGSAPGPQTFGCHGGPARDHISQTPAKRALGKDRATASEGARTGACGKQQLDPRKR